MVRFQPNIGRGTQNWNDQETASDIAAIHASKDQKWSWNQAPGKSWNQHQCWLDPSTSIGVQGTDFDTWRRHSNSDGPRNHQQNPKSQKPAFPTHATQKVLLSPIPLSRHWARRRPWVWRTLGPSFWKTLIPWQTYQENTWPKREGRNLFTIQNGPWYYRRSVRF